MTTPAPTFPARLAQSNPDPRREYTLLYRGYQIECRRGPTLAGWTAISWAIFRKRDMVECDSSCTEERSTARAYARGLMRRVDAEMALPFSERWGGLLEEIRVDRWRKNFLPLPAHRTPTPPHEREKGEAR